LPTYRVSES